MNAPGEDPAGAARQHARRGHQPCERAPSSHPAGYDGYDIWARHGNDIQDNTRTAFQTTFRDEDDLADTRQPNKRKANILPGFQRVFQREIDVTV